MRHKIFSIIPGFYPLVASRIQSCDNQKCLQSLPSVPGRGGTNLLSVKNHCSMQIKTIDTGGAHTGHPPSLKTYLSLTAIFNICNIFNICSITTSFRSCSLPCSFILFTDFYLFHNINMYLLLEYL